LNPLSSNIITGGTKDVKYQCQYNDNLMKCGFTTVNLGWFAVQKWLYDG